MEKTRGKKPTGDSLAVYTLPADILDEVLDQAATRGARKALADLGLNGNNGKKAAQDIHDLREILRSYQQAKDTLVTTTVRTVTLALLGALAIGIYIGLGELQ